MEAAGRRAIVCQLDQREPAGVARMFERAERELAIDGGLEMNMGQGA